MHYQCYIPAVKNVQPFYGEPNQPTPHLFVIEIKKYFLTSPNQLKRTWQRALQNGCSAVSLVQLHFYGVVRLTWLQVGSERRLIVASSSSATVQRITASASPWTTEVPEVLTDCRFCWALSPVPLPLFRPRYIHLCHPIQSSINLIPI